eukprot:669741-Rhodomonas_salina.2
MSRVYCANARKQAFDPAEHAVGGQSVLKNRRRHDGRKRDTLIDSKGLLQLHVHGAVLPTGAQRLLAATKSDKEKKKLIAYSSSSSSATSSR